MEIQASSSSSTSSGSRSAHRDTCFLYSASESPDSEPADSPSESLELAKFPSSSSNTAVSFQVSVSQVLKKPSLPTISRDLPSGENETPVTSRSAGPSRTARVPPVATSRTRTTDVSGLSSESPPWAVAMRLLSGSNESAKVGTSLYSGCDRKVLGCLSIRGIQMQQSEPRIHAR